MKNYVQLKQDDYRQLHGYLGRDNGRCGFIVTRSVSEALGDRERSWVRELYNTHQVLLIHLPVILLTRCIGKMKSPERKDYSGRILGKRLDTYLRSYTKESSTRR